ncbi:MAG: SPOR domain-containing protein [Pseudohongiellaceae bacterium]
MKEATKQRIVGTVVLLALGLIFLPLVFDGEGSYQTPVASRIPEPPIVPILPEPEPTRPQIIADQLPDEPSAAETAIETETPVATPEEDTTAPDSAVEVVESAPDFEREIPQFDANGMPQAWVVRLGTFANAANANNLVARLQDAGFKAYTRSVNNADSDMTAVFVGPWLQRQLVEDYRQQLQEQFQLAGMIVRYEIDPL